jgi:hypothetical protein
VSRIRVWATQVTPGVCIAGAGAAAVVAILGALAAGQEAAVLDRASFPQPSTTGVPHGWKPAVTYTTALHVTRRGAVVEDVRLVNANLVIDADDVTVRRVEIQSGRIYNEGGFPCHNGLLVEDVTLTRATGRTTSANDEPAIGIGGYTARRVKIDGLAEGFRVGGRSNGCGPVTIEDSFARITPPEPCDDWHGDGIQAYDGAELLVRNVTLELVETKSCAGNAPFFYPHSQGNQSVAIEGLLVKAGGFPFRLDMPGSVRGLRIVAGSWGYRPIDVKCSVIRTWEAQVVKIDSNYQVTGVVWPQPCNSEGGN